MNNRLDISRYGYISIRDKNDIEVAKGHEFHYSSIVASVGGEETTGHQLTARDESAPTLLYRKGNVLAGYTHLYFAEQDPFALFD